MVIEKPELLDQPAGAVYAIPVPLAWSPDCPSKQPDRDHLLVGIIPRHIIDRSNRNVLWQLGQFYGLVVPGLIVSERLFRGLRRGMYVGDDQEAAPSKMAATWRAKRDAQWIGPAHDGTIEFRDAPSNPDRVFCVYISPNRMLPEYPSIHGWVERWTWIVADPSSPGAPINWNKRYDESVWPEPASHPATTEEGQS